MTSDFLIKQNGPVTDEELLELRASVGWDNKTGSPKEVLRRLFTYFTARYEGRLVGFVDVLSDGIADAYLQDLMVHPDFQRKGVGTQLVKSAIWYLQSINIKAIQTNFNPGLEEFYKKFGFHIYQAGILDRDAVKKP